MLAGFIASRKHFRCFLSLGDFASCQSRLTTSHVMTASRSVRELIFWQSVSRKGLDETRRTIDHTDFAPYILVQNFDYLEVFLTACNVVDY